MCWFAHSTKVPQEPASEVSDICISTSSADRTSPAGCCRSRTPLNLGRALIIARKVTPVRAFREMARLAENSTKLVILRRPRGGGRGTGSDRAPCLQLDHASDLGPSRATRLHGLFDHELVLGCGSISACYASCGGMHMQTCLSPAELRFSRSTWCWRSPRPSPARGSCRRGECWICVSAGPPR